CPDQGAHAPRPPRTLEYQKSARNRAGNGRGGGNAMTNDELGPLAGVRVLDASRVLAGPFCGQLLGDLGGEGLKVERPGAGDETRAWGPPFHDDLSAYYLSCNRNKRGLTLDLAHPEGLRLFHELVKKSDVLLENFRAGSAGRLGLGPDKLLSLNPRLVV